MSSPPIQPVRRPHDNHSALHSGRRAGTSRVRSEKRSRRSVMPDAVTPQPSLRQHTRPRQEGRAANSSKSLHHRHEQRALRQETQLRSFTTPRVQLRSTGVASRPQRACTPSKRTTTCHGLLSAHAQPRRLPVKSLSLLSWARHIRSVNSVVAFLQVEADRVPSCNLPYFFETDAFFWCRKRRPKMERKHQLQASTNSERKRLAVSK